MPNKLYHKRKSIPSWDDKGEQLTCHQCGRDFFQAEEDLAPLRADGCPSEDCPSHWEVQGLPHPDHTPVTYKGGYGESYKPDYDAAFIAFWRKQSRRNPTLETDTLADRFWRAWDKLSPQLSAPSS